VPASLRRALRALPASPCVVLRGRWLQRCGLVSGRGVAVRRALPASRSRLRQCPARHESGEGARCRRRCGSLHGPRCWKRGRAKG